MSTLKSRVNLTLPFLSFSVLHWKIGESFGCWSTHCCLYNVYISAHIEWLYCDQGEASKLRLTSLITLRMLTEAI